jgi:hypothetical protein
MNPNAILKKIMSSMIIIEASNLPHKNWNSASDSERALQAERESKKEVVRVTLENDELAEKLNYIESKY